tara:strand:- start:199 stop:540 length:342 start_codon:yes stop_codon:yes gene_type:complete
MKINQIAIQTGQPRGAFPSGAGDHRRAAQRAKAHGQTLNLTEAERAACIGTYTQSKRMNQIFGKGTWEVDHTVPFALGGLHHPSNLQIVPTGWNKEKRNNHSHRWEIPYEAAI